MKNKILILSVLIFFSFFISNVSAYLLTDATWNNGEENIEINFGNNAKFYVNVETDSIPLYISITFDENEFHNEISMERVYDKEFLIESPQIGRHNIVVEVINQRGEVDVRELILNVIRERRNNPPEVTVIYPNGGEDLSGIVNVRWRATDLDNDELTINVEYSEDGRRWDVLYDPLENDGFEPWDTNNHPNGEYMIKVTAYDGETFASDISDGSFRILNYGDNPNLPNAYITSPRNRDYNLNNIIQFRGYGEDRDGDEIINYEWNLGNNLIIHEQNFEYSYNQIGNYQVSFRVQDEHGAWSLPVSVRLNIIEGQSNQKPFVNILRPSERSVVSGDYNIMWESGDVDGRIMNTKIYYRKYSQFPLIGNLLDFFNDYSLLSYLPGHVQNYAFDTRGFRNGEYSIKIVVSDDDYSSEEDVVERFKVFNKAVIANRPPFITTQPVTRILINTDYYYDVNAVDPDENRLTYSLVDYPSGMEIDSGTGVIKWWPRRVGIYNVKVVVRDNRGAYDEQEFSIIVFETERSREKEKREMNEFSISNMVLDQDDYYISVFIQVMNKGNKDQKISLKVFNINTGDFVVDSFNLDNQDNYWRILKLPKPLNKGIYTVAVFGNSKDYKDMLYREIIVY